MLFSILIANYNNGSFFKDCYASIMNQSYQDFEVIIGVNTIIEPSAIICGVNGKAKRIVIGDNCYIGSNVQIICRRLL